jgi:hypothetical protein
MMAALVKALSQTTSKDIEIEGLKIIVIFCAAGLLLSIMAAMTYGLNLTADLF